MKLQLIWHCSNFGGKEKKQNTYVKVLKINPGKIPM